jgi:hypothetical protein
MTPSARRKPLRLRRCSPHRDARDRQGPRHGFGIEAVRDAQVDVDSLVDHVEGPVGQPHLEPHCWMRCEEPARMGVRSRVKSNGPATRKRPRGSAVSSPSAASAVERLETL